MKLFDPTKTAMDSLADTVAEIAAIQARLVARHDRLVQADRVAHQQQLAGSIVELRVAETLPDHFEGVGLFEPGHVHTGIGRISNGLGCPHLETDIDFLGIMLAYSVDGRRCDFLGINHPASPTDTVEEFVALLAATAESAGVDIPFGDIGQLDLGNLSASQLKLFDTLRKRLGLLRATGIYAHIAKQTARTLISSTAYQQYWTGVVRVGDVLGKFTLLPTEDVNTHRGLTPGESYLTEDWRKRQQAGDLSFDLSWIAYTNDDDTPLERLTEDWAENHRIRVGEVVFPRQDPATREAKLFAILASEMGANPGNWIRDRDPAGDGRGVPSTEFTAGRFLAYANSQQGRSVLPEESYDSVFAMGQIASELEAELLRRYRAKRERRHAQPDLGSIE